MKKEIEIIAEIGWNHLGDMDIAKRMIDAAAESGADYAKFQTWSVKRLKRGDWDTDGRREIYEKAELDEKRHAILKRHCKYAGIKFMSSVFSIEDAKLYSKYQSKYVKIPSFESRNDELLNFCGNTFDYIFISTGTSTLSEISVSINNLLSTNLIKLVLLHCVSAYPLDPRDANINRLRYLKSMSFDNNCIEVGYSDHMIGIESAKVAIELGATVIEKHFTIDRSLPGRDNAFACLPDDIKNLKNYIILRKDMLSKNSIDFMDIEKGSRENYAGRFDG